MNYFIKTFGCQMNESDSERISSFFESQGFKETKEINKADIVIFNTCGVRQTAEDRVYGQVHNLRKASPDVKIVITGCVAHRKDVQRRLKEKVDLFISINDIEKIPELLSIPQKEKGAKCNNYLDIKPKYAKKGSAFVPIMTGCDNFCSYCVVPYARGREKSRPTKEIFKEIKKLSENNCKEITLLGQNVSSYKSEKNFSELLNSLARKFTDIQFIFLTSHPKDFSEDLMNIIAENDNVSKKIHLPFQSGSDKILKAMNRPYTQKHYLNLIKKAQEIIPGVTFTTDVIVGFPGETKEDFSETVKVFEKVNYTEAYINKYSPRPETAALKFGDPIEWSEKKRREKHLRQFVKK